MNSTATPPAHNPVRRWWIYQKERFPLGQYGLLVGLLSGASIIHSASLRGAYVSRQSMLVAFASGLAFFFLLRVADEFKDVEVDRITRPYRPVPRGLVELRELTLLGVGAALLQLGLTLWLDPALFFPLVAAWLYFGLMTAEFFAPAWLRKRPAIYLLSHSLIVPLIVLYMTACDWLASGSGWPKGLAWFLGASWFGGLVFEVGRKLRSPAGEVDGVETYTRAWGTGPAIGAWLGAVGLAFSCSVMAALETGTTGPTFLLLGVLAALLACFAYIFWQRPTSSRARRFEALSALWLIGQYGMLSLPLVL